MASNDDLVPSLGALRIAPLSTDSSVLTVDSVHSRSSHNFVYNYSSIIAHLSTAIPRSTPLPLPDVPVILLPPPPQTFEYGVWKPAIWELSTTRTGQTVEKTFSPTSLIMMQYQYNVTPSPPGGCCKSSTNTVKITFRRCNLSPCLYWQRVLCPIILTSSCQCQNFSLYATLSKSCFTA